MPSRTRATGSRAAAPAATQLDRSRPDAVRRGGRDLLAGQHPRVRRRRPRAGASGDQLAGPALRRRRRRARTSCRRRQGEDLRRPFSIDASYALSRALWMQQTHPDRVGSNALDPVAEGLLRRHPHRVGPLGPRVAGRARRHRRRLPRRAPSPSSTARRRGCRRSTSSTPSPGGPPGRWGSPPSVPVSVGTMDAWSSIYGSGVVRAGQGAEISGTSEIVGLLSAQPGAADGVISFPPVRARYPPRRRHAGGR